MGCIMRFAQARLCPPTLEQLAANEAAKLGEEYFRDIHAEWDKRRNIVFTELEKKRRHYMRETKGCFLCDCKTSD